MNIKKVKERGEIILFTSQNNLLSLPFPTRWGISTDIAGRPLVRGDLPLIRSLAAQ
ncbi:hypothetical protein ACE198_17105 [Neobacillus sp. KR4-4]|uniref:hypothetical protein n=1 Tax=Neobacillus sp. KR4-4 TaxID=3344872 RepID=UPI0035CBA6B0